MSTVLVFDETEENLPRHLLRGQRQRLEMPELDPNPNPVISVGLTNCRTNARGLKITEQNAQPLQRHLQTVRLSSLLG